MSTYDGLFLRSTLGSTNTIPKIGAQSHSPDLIPYGTKPAADPATTFSDYGTDYGKTLEAGVPNYLYMRAKNYGANSYSENPRLFHSESSLLSYPSKWVEITDTGSGSKPTISAAAGAVGIVDTPFVWAPDNPGSGWHYCLIGMVPTPGLPDPEEVLNTFQIDSLANLVANTGGLSWRNISVTPTSNINLTQNQMYNQGALASNIQLTLICENVPLGASVSFSAGNPGTTPAVYLAPTKVTTFPSFTTGIVVQVPANWSSVISMTMSAPAGTSLVGAKMHIQAAYPTAPGTDLFMYGHTQSELGIPHPDMARNNIMRQLYYADQPLQLQPEHEQYLEQLVSLQANIGPSRLIVVGENAVHWQD